MMFDKAIFAIAAFALSATQGMAENSETNLRRNLGKTNKDKDNLFVGGNGKTTLTKKFTYVALLDPTKCFDPYAWCDTSLIGIVKDIIDEEGEEMEPEEQLDLENWLYIHYCNSATNAFAKMDGFVFGEGAFNVTRHGNNGAVTSINLAVDLSSAAFAIASAASSKSEYEYAYARAYTSIPTQCDTKYLPGSLRYRLCVYGYSGAYAGADAYASATGKAKAEAGSLASTDTSVHVDGKNIQEFNATVSTSARNFVLTETTTAVEAYTYASSSVYSYLHTSVTTEQYMCVRTRRVTDYCHRHFCFFCDHHCHYRYVCAYYGWRQRSSSWNARIVRYISDYDYRFSRSFAKAYAKSLASLNIKAKIPVYFKNEKGNDDTMIFPQDADDVPIEVTASCHAQADTESRSFDGDDYYYDDYYDY